MTGRRGAGAALASEISNLLMNSASEYLFPPDPDSVLAAELARNQSA